MQEEVKWVEPHLEEQIMEELTEKDLNQGQASKEEKLYCTMD